MRPRRELRKRKQSLFTFPGKAGCHSTQKGLTVFSRYGGCRRIGHPIGDAGATALAEALKSNSTLKALRLDSNDIGYEGAMAMAMAMAEALKTNSTLKEIRLDFNNIGDEGAAALAETLKRNSTLHRLCLTNNNIGDEGAIALAERGTEERFDTASIMEIAF